MRDGLPGMSVRSIYKDTHGLMWIGTDTGLCSFDGKSFRIYKPSEGMTAGMVWAITEDNNGNLWFGSYGSGLYKYDGVSFTHISQNEGLATDWIRVLYWSERFQCLMAGGEGGISAVYGDSIVNCTKEIISNSNIKTVTGFTDTQNFIYVTSYGNPGPLRYYPDKNELITAHTSDCYYPQSSFSVFVTSENDTVFSYNHSGIAIYRENEIFRNESMGQIFGIDEDNNGKLWMASWSYTNRKMIGGIFRYDGKTIKNYKDAFGIKDQEIWTVYYDKEQNLLWIGTCNEGMFRVSYPEITSYSPTDLNLKDNYIRTIFNDSKNRLWISGSKDLSRFDKNQESSNFDKKALVRVFKKFWEENDYRKINPEFIHTFSPVHFDSKALDDYAEGTVFDFGEVIQDGEENFIITNKLGTFHYNDNKKNFRYLNLDGFNYIPLVYHDTLLYCGGLTMIHPDFRNSDIRNLIGFQFMQDSLEKFNDRKDPRNVTQVKRFGNRNWYTSWVSGLWMSEGMNLINFNETDTTISNNLNDICFDVQGNIIFGSNTGVIYIATYAEKKLQIKHRISSDQGLLGNSISWLIVDHDNNLWAGTNRGLNCIQLDELYKSGTITIRFLDDEDGYHGLDSRRALIDSSGILWIANDDKLIRLNTKNFFTSSSGHGSLFIKALEINNAPLDTAQYKGFDGWSPVKNIKLRHSDNNLTFHIDKLNYRNPGKDRFRYRLEGLNDTWTAWSVSREAIFTNLSPGRYKLHVESNNLSDPANTEMLIYDFAIRHPWWGLWYLQLIIVLLMVGLLFFSMRYHYERKKKKLVEKTEIEKKIIKLEMQALQAQMNPHFVFNCINGIQSFVLSDKRDKVLDYLTDFSNVVRASLENASRTYMRLSQEIEFLNSYLRLEQMRFPNKFDFQINTAEIADTANLQIPPMLIQPFAENSVRHGFMKLNGKGHLNIEFQITGEDVIRCSITDNGIGRDKARQINGHQLEDDRTHSAEITETRLKLFVSEDLPQKYKVDYTDLFENGTPAGLKVDIFLPALMIRRTNAHKEMACS